MGAGGSLQNNNKNPEPPPLPPPFGPFGPGGPGGPSGLSRFSRISTISDNPLTTENEGKNHDNLNTEEWWQNRPSAPSLQSFNQHQETLLTYASQMTGWQSEYSNVQSLHQEAMELTRTVSHLAAANQQLATAHSALLSQVEILYMEINKNHDRNTNKHDDNLNNRVEIIEDIIKKNKIDEKNLQCSDNLKNDYDMAMEKIKILEDKINENNKKFYGKNNIGTNDEDLIVEMEKIKSQNLELHEIIEKFKIDFDIVQKNISTIDCKKQKAELIEIKHLHDADKKKIINIESKLKSADDECHKLRSRLHEEIENNKKNNEIIDKTNRDNKRLIEKIEIINKSHNVSDAETSMEDDLYERQNLEEFKKDLSMKREARQRAIAAVSSEMERLKKELDAEKVAHSETSKILDILKTQAENGTSCNNVKLQYIEVSTNTPDDWNDKTTKQSANLIQKNAQRLTDVLKVTDELRSCIRLQIEKIDDLRFHLECEPDKYKQKIKLLNDIAIMNKESYGNRQIQINYLKNLQTQFVNGFIDNEKINYDIDDDLRLEHDRQIDDVKKLKKLYDERMRILVDLKETIGKEFLTTKEQLKCAKKDKEYLDEEIKKAEEKIDEQDSVISNLESQLGLTKADCRDLQNQMSVINNLFSQMLLSASSADMDLDRLTELIQENHDLISDMAKEEGTEAAALPKLLLDLVEQVDGIPEKKDEDNIQEENIANNLPKVWKVLLELLSCHEANTANTSTVSASLVDDPNICYKSVDTPSGPRLVISVSKTYIRLKELILEKKSLEKEMGRMKQLNLHLESKLGEQEKRLSTVADELSKTWNIVGRMQAQHQQLHTHEKILRYELQQKRKMLQELKQELEYCREKWESARQKNTNTEIEWRNLRREFAARKALAAQESFNTSRQNIIKAPEQQTATSEVEESMKIVEVNNQQDINSIEPTNPLDQALENVIQNLINIDDNNSSNSMISDEPDKNIQCANDETVSVFSIGPFPQSSKMVQFSDPLVVGPSIQSDEIVENKIVKIENNTADEKDDCLAELKDEKVDDKEDEKKIEDTEKIVDHCSDPSGSTTSSKATRTPEEVLAARSERLKRLEEQADWLMKKMNATNRRGSELSNRLEELHETYGDAPAPPPMPDVLPIVRLPTNQEGESRNESSANNENEQTQ
ncbi:golgin subfamily A member 4 [Aphidius gifuensis]|uniref:golgin subfamily A member 4 n=1 Tax=Aphidius gifuensis TaxID=684658 RepID=UPI001CDC76D5|nr:golgin subfamily A member 4 [Aphidius gifuensis]